MEAGDSQKFADSLAEFDSMTRLDAWKTSLLLKVRWAALKKLMRLVKQLSP